jgi:cysteine-rich repeat protein
VVASNGFLGDHRALTLSCWIRPYSAVIAKQAILGSESDEPKRAVSRSNAGLRLLQGGDVVFLAGANFSRAPRAPVELNRWTHVAGTYDAAEAGGTARLYIGGVLAAQASNLGACTVVERPFYVARATGISEDLRYSGLVDEVSVWTRALTLAEVQAVAHQQLVPGQNGLALYLVGDGDTNTRAIDRSGTNQTATLVPGDKIAKLQFFGWRADCVGCFDAQFPRCAPWSSNDTCGDDAITGAEACEPSGGSCDSSTCQCSIGHEPGSGEMCVRSNETCSYYNSLQCIYAITDCRNDCPCVATALHDNCTAHNCHAYDLSMLATFAWPTCASQCIDNASVCYNIIPDGCLRYNNEFACSNASCMWCTDHCAADLARCMPRCGNSRLDPLEQCDDGNDVGLDGCAADCSAVEPGWNCISAGQACVTNCSDGLTAGAEECDDGNTIPGDGCWQCTIERGWECDVTAVPSICHKATLSTVSIIIIAVACAALLALISGGVALIVIYVLKRGRWKHKKLPGMIEIALTSIFGADHVGVEFYDLTQSRYIDPKDFPIKIEPMVLTFGFDEADRAPVDELIADNVSLSNTGSSGLYFRVCPQPSQKWLITSNGTKSSLPQGESITQQVQLYIGATTKIEADVAVVISDKPFDEKIDHRHTFFRVHVESKLSTKLDPDEIELIDPPIGDGSFGTVYRGTYRSQDVAIKVLKF